MSNGEVAELIDDAEAASLISTKSIQPSPDVVSKLIRRLRALTFKLLPVEVELESISNPTSRVVTPQVVKAYSLAAGDYGEALPYALLRARQMFIWDANHNAADYDEHMCRATACEVIARRVIHNSPPERLNSLMSTRFRYREWDGDQSNLSSALELAIDQHCTIFLSSTECQFVINSLWTGSWVQQNNENHDIDYVSYEKSDYVKQSKSFWRHLDPARIAVPRYQNSFRIAVWFVFLFVYSQAVRTPLERREAGYPFDWIEGVLYTMALSFAIEDCYRLFKILWFFTFRALSFWSIVGLTTDALICTAFILRIMGIISQSEQADLWHFRSFQILSCVSPLIWMKLITVVDGFKYIGTMQICVSRMFQESTIFFLLLSVLLIGFTQAMYALDAADGYADRGYEVLNELLQALLQAPDFNAPKGNVGLLLYYFWCLATTIILLNILISLFASAYDDVVQDSEAQYLAFYAGKTVDMIRAPDSFLYPAPFNLVEAFLVAPWEPFISQESYYKLNVVVMRTLFFVPLVSIALFEAYLDPKGNSFTRAWFEAHEEEEEDDPECQDPTVEDEEGLQISKVPFNELLKQFPNTAMSVEATIIEEVKSLKTKLETILEKLDQLEKKS